MRSVKNNLTAFRTQKKETNSESHLKKIKNDELDMCNNTLSTYLSE